MPKKLPLSLRSSVKRLIPTKILKDTFRSRFLRRDLLQEVSTSPLSMRSYQGIVPIDLYREILDLAKPLKGLRVAMLNATPYGGGVAEIFKSMVPLMHSLGIKVSWYVMPADEEFFRVTKGMHNGLQGADYKLTPEAEQIYMEYNRRTARMLGRLSPDIFEIHDPQPAAVNQFIDLKNSIWRCHIDTSTPNKNLWDFLRPIIEKYDQLVFTIPEFAHSDLPLAKLNFIAPTIDALSVKNQPFDIDVAREMIKTLGIDTTRPLMTQVSRFDPWKDPIGVIDAYHLVKKKIPTIQLALVGSMANDDPEGLEILNDLQKYAKQDKDVFIYSNLTGVGEIEVNAFQTYSQVLVQKSIREGFGLTVTEAMWKAKPVIGGNVGGIPLQIKDGQTGFLVNSIEECADRTIQLLNDKQKSQRMGQQARRHVRANFLHPRLIRDHLKLYQNILKVK